MAIAPRSVPGFNVMPPMRGAPMQLIPPEVLAAAAAAAFHPPGGGMGGGMPMMPGGSGDGMGAAIAGVGSLVDKARALWGKEKPIPGAGKPGMAGMDEFLTTGGGGREPGWFDFLTNRPGGGSTGGSPFWSSYLGGGTGGGGYGGGSFAP